MNNVPLILLPGLLSDHTVWEHQIIHLNEVAPIIVPDLAMASTPEAMIDAVLKVAPEQFYLAGHSMGGWVALEVIKQCPDRVKKLCLLNTAAGLDDEKKRENRQRMIAAVEQGDIETIIGQLTTLFTFNQHVYMRVEQMFRRNIKSFINHEKAMMLRQDHLPYLGLIKCPTWVVHARHDKVFSLQHSEALLAGIKHAKLAIVEDCGHMSPIEMPQAITALLRFWLLYTHYTSKWEY